MLGKYKKKTQRKLNPWVFLFCCCVNIHKVMDIKRSIFTAFLLVHLFLGCVKHLNTNKMSVAKVMKANSRELYK